MNSAELFIAIQNIDKKPPSELPAEVVECMVQCFRSGWKLEYINHPQYDTNGWVDHENFLSSEFVEVLLRTQKVSCFRVVVW